MAFSKKYSSGIPNVEETVEAHPILEKGSVSIAVKQYYLQGCVVAALMDADAISSQVRDRLERLGRSLKMSEDEIRECIEVVTGLDSGNGDWEAFTTEMLEALKSAKVGVHFLKDFEDIMAVSHEISSESYAHLNRFGTSLMDEKLWRLSVLLDDASGYSAKDRQPPKCWQDACLAAKYKGDRIATECWQFVEKLTGSGKSSADFKSKEETEWVKRFADHGNANALCVVGSVVLASKDNSEDKGRGFEFLLASANAGNADAQYKVGCSYHKGNGCKKDDNAAFKWFKKAADQGNMEAVNMVGEFYQKSLACDVWPKDEECNAEAYFKKSAEAGVVDAQYNLAELFDGRCYYEDYSSALRYNGVLYGQRTRTSGWSDDKENALKWYRKAAAQGHEKSKEKASSLEDERKSVVQESNRQALMVAEEDARKTMCIVYWAVFFACSAAGSKCGGVLVIVWTFAYHIFVKRLAVECIAQNKVRNSRH